MSRHASIAIVVLAACGGSEPPGGTCLDSARGPMVDWFADVTDASEIDFAFATTGFKGGALVVADLDGDGRPEIVTSRRERGGTAVFRNEGDLRFSQLADSGISDAIAASAGAAADLDNDGDLDLVLAGANEAHVLMSQGGRFTSQRLVDTGTTEHVLAVDVDGNGLLDLYFSNYDTRTGMASRDRLYMNRGGLAFDAVVSPIADLTWTTTALDVDVDGDQDLYLANDTLVPDHGVPLAEPPPWPSDRLLRNDGLDADGHPILTDVAPAMGLATPRSSMGGVVADFDGDGTLDLFVTDFGPNKLFVRDADQFVDRAAALGLGAGDRRNAHCDTNPASDDCLLLSWSAAVSDFDGDGYDDILVVNGETSPADPPPIQVFTRDVADAVYRERSTTIPCVDARSLIASDLDGDGDQDLVLAPPNGSLAIYETRGRPRDGSWLHVTLRGTASNRDGAGSVVTVRLVGGRTLVRAVGTSGIVHAGTSADAWFGLAADAVSELVVRWPSGRQSVVAGPVAGALLIEEP